MNSDYINSPDTDKALSNIPPDTFKINNGNTFIVMQDAESEYLYDVKIIGVGFRETADTILFDEIERVDTIMIADIDNNGDEELYIFTRGFSDGAFDHVFGVTSVGDEYYSEILFPPFSPEDFLPGGTFEGYNGKDVYRIKDNVLERTFPVHRAGDTYENPELGFRTVYYSIEKNSSGYYYKIRK